MTHVQEPGRWCRRERAAAGWRASGLVPPVRAVVPPGAAESREQARAAVLPEEGRQLTALQLGRKLAALL